jgi:hypothetical protein
MRLQSPMVKRKPLSKINLASSRRPLAVRFIFAFSVLLCLATATSATPLSEYHKRIQQAVTALDTLANSEEAESVAAYATRDAETVASVRTLLPKTETVEWNSSSFDVDNSWLHDELDRYAAEKSAERYKQLKRITVQLAAVESRVAELENPATRNGASKDEEVRKLGEILRRAEYARKVKEESAMSRLFERFLKWFANLFPKRRQMSPGRAGIFSAIAQVVVIGVALAALIYVLKLFLPRMLGGRRSKKKSKAEARIVLGERLEPDQSARDLLAEAEGLARRGELRAAIRKAYIALLVEMGDRKIISLAQYKTNRDYLRAVREIEPLYGNVKQLTDSFERHWYGLANATETDWRAFRTGYERALLRVK